MRVSRVITGAELFLKLEAFQFTGSFKDRGALTRLLAMSAAERAAGVIAMSAGNHAQAVAYHARRLGIDATIVMPSNTPLVKISNTEKLGARVVLHGETLTEASDFANRQAAAEGRVFVHPYDDERIIAGQGTVALEMFAERPDLDAIVVPIGGGGLIAGCAITARAISPNTEVIGVQAALCPSMAATLRGEAAPTAGQTIAEGIAVKDPGQLTSAIIAEHVTDILLVSEGAIERAITLIVEIEKVVTEGAGAVSLAAVLGESARFAGKRVGLTDPDPGREALWYQRAAEAGQAEAQYNLSVLFSMGEGVPHDLVSAYAWMRIATDGGVGANAEMTMLESLLNPQQRAAAESKIEQLSTQIKPRHSRG